MFGGTETRTALVSSFRDMNDRELDDKIQEIRSEIFIEKASASTFGMGYSEKGSGTLRQLKRDLARALTVKSERKNEGPR